MLADFADRIRILGVSMPSDLTSDECCSVRRFIQEALPGTDVNLDVWHYIQR